MSDVNARANWHTLLVRAGSIVAALAVVAGPALAADDAGQEFFESKIRPLLAERCIRCHGEKKQKGGLRLDSRMGWQHGGASGTALVPGKPEQSLLVKAVSYTDKDLQMPPGKQLTAVEVEQLKEWIRRGAPDPRTAAVVIVRTEAADWAQTFKKRLDWWSLRPLRPPQPPAVREKSWAQEPADSCVRAALDAAGLTPAPPAGPEVLLRRLAFVLTGLPPTVAQREQFLAHWQRDKERAYETLVDDLLASPHFGECFARHWMDVVRYTDTYGYEWDNPAKGSWEYRDYLIRVFNQDIGFDQFLTEQLAGDLLPQQRIDARLGLNESLIGPMFYHLGEHRHGSSLEFNGIHQDMVNNKIDAFSKAFLATTVACARCHDHKLEAVSQRDYYALAAVFMTPRWTSRVVDAPGKNDAAIARLKELRDKIRSALADRWLAASKQDGAELATRLKQTGAWQDAATAKIDDIGYPIAKLLASPKDVDKVWNGLAAEWRQVRAKRIQANSGFKPLTTFATPTLPEGWVIEGDGMVHGFVEDGTPLIALEGDAVAARLLRRGYHTHALSSKLPGSLRMPPEHLVPGKVVSLQLAGGEFSGYLPMPGNAFQNEPLEFLATTAPVWKPFVDRPLKNGVPGVTVEFATASLNPNFPPRTGLAPGLAHSDLGYEKRSWLSITGIVCHETDGTPQDTLDSFITLYDGTPAKAGQSAERRIGAWLAGAVRRWSDGRPEPGDVPLLDWLLAKKLLPNRAEAGSQLASWLDEYRRVERGIAHARTVNSMDERGVARAGYPLNVRGNVDTLGEMVAPDFLQMFACRNGVAASHGSGRLELAESLLQPDHPLTARVYVNRVWQWLFGTGIVASPDDFGHLGDKPSHPELLDYLATEFICEGWSTKKLVRRLVLSQTFRQSGTACAVARERDPSNRLVHHYPTRRLEAEAIRDSLLAVSGRLDPALYGRPIDPPRSAEDSNKRLFSGPLDSFGRRSLYLKMSIMEPPRFLVSFNLPDLKLPTGKRDVTNVPAQALVMLNDPLVNAMARHWAGRLIKMPHASAEERIDTMFLEAFARKPDNVERKRWLAAVHDFALAGPSLMTDEVAWQRLAHAVFNTKEFLYYR